MSEIDITGVNLRKLVQEVYAASSPQGFGLLHYQKGVIYLTQNDGKPESAARQVGAEVEVTPEMIEAGTWTHTYMDCNTDAPREAAAEAIFRVMLDVAAGRVTPHQVRDHVNASTGREFFQRYVRACPL